MPERPDKVRRGDRPKASVQNALVAAFRAARVFVAWPLRVTQTSACTILSADPRWFGRRFASVVSGPAGDNSYQVQPCRRKPSTHSWTGFGANRKAWELNNNATVPANVIVEILSDFGSAEILFQLDHC